MILLIQYHIYLHQKLIKCIKNIYFSKIKGIVFWHFFKEIKLTNHLGNAFISNK